MADPKAIAAAADRYSYMLDGAREGVVLAGRLGSVAAWEDGVVELKIDQAAAEAGSTPYWACRTDPAQLAEAKRHFGAWAGL